MESKNLDVFNSLKEAVILPKTEYTSTGVDTNRNNVVSKEKLREVQIKTLSKLSDFLSCTFGPMGSNTKLLKGNDANTILSEYSKDGHKVLKNIRFSNPIEMSIQAELVDITHHVEHEVGDGTTSAVILASKIFEYIVGIMDQDPTIQPYKVIYTFTEVVKTIQDQILCKNKEVEPKDIYDICMISTNGNKEIAENITRIYEEYGMDVSIDVSISTTKDSAIKIYDGLTVSEGYSDPAYINNKSNGTAEIHNARVYAFFDPVDTMDMISLFEKIVMTNIIEPYSEAEEMIPTVIISPKMSRDMSSLMQSVVEILHQSEFNQKPPILVITDITGVDEEIYLDIARLCGCKYIKKYIDPKIKEADEARGLAANLENVCNFYGECELVVSDVSKTKFVNPAKMYEVNDEGERVPSSEFNGLVSFLEAELNNAKVNGEDSRSIGRMRKRLKSLNANMVEYMVGGISISDRDSVKDLVEDAVKNCASACKDGWGYAANFEGLMASMIVAQSLGINNFDSLESKLAFAIFEAYVEVVELLYSTVLEPGKIDDAIEESIRIGAPMNLRSGKFDGVVKTSIMTDVKILEAISKLITIMVTSNQCLVQAPQLNTY